MYSIKKMLRVSAQTRRNELLCKTLNEKKKIVAEE